MDHLLFSRSDLLSVYADMSTCCRVRDPHMYAWVHACTICMHPMHTHACMQLLAAHANPAVALPTLHGKSEFGRSSRRPSLRSELIIAHPAPRGERGFAQMRTERERGGRSEVTTRPIHYFFPSVEPLGVLPPNSPERSSQARRPRTPR